MSISFDFVGEPLTARAFNPKTTVAEGWIANTVKGEVWQNRLLHSDKCLLRQALVTIWCIPHKRESSAEMYRTHLKEPPVEI
jgi:hypothetical protein